MSSLRLALKQSLEDAQPQAPRQGKKPGRRPGRPRGRPPKRKPGDPPRKRGRPRKNPLPEEEEEEHHSEEEDASSSSSEAEFSVSQEDDEDSDTEHELHKEEEEEHDESSEDEEEKRRKQRKMQKKAMKRQQNSAANKIQSHWKKKKRSGSTDETEQEETKKKKKSQDEHDQEKQKEDDEKKSSSSGKAKTVPPPDPDLVAYQRGLSPKKQRRNMAAGLRVKVRFATKVRKRDGKIATKLKWYGGLVTRVSTGGSKIRIKYDDGTSEVSKFPDNDVIVDETGNGEHRVSAGRFIPPSQRAAAAAPPAEEEPQTHEEDVSERKTTSPKPKKLKRSPSKGQKEEKEEKSADATAEKEPESKELSPPAKSPRKKKQSPAKKQATPSPKHDKEQAKSPDIEMEDSRGEVADNATEETKQAMADDDSGDVHTESSGSRKKLSLKIRLKVPTKSSPVASPRDDVKNEAKGDEDDGAKERDTMHVDEEPQVEPPVQSDKEQQEAVSKSPELAADGSDVAETKSPSHGKKRAFDNVEGEEAPEEPPQKKRVEKSVGDTSDAEKPKDVEKEEPEKADEMMEVDGLENEDDVEKESEAPEELAVTDTEKERKRKREAAEEGGDDESPPVGGVPEEAESLEEKKSRSSDAEDHKLEEKASEDAMQVDSDDATPEEVDADPTDSKNCSVEQKDQESPRLVSSESAKDETFTAAAAKSPRPSTQSDDFKEDDKEIKSVPIPTIPRFGRRAAQQANERIAARKERIIEDEFAKKKKQRKEKLAEQKLMSPTEGKRKRGDDESGDDEIDGKWVQCDNCSKWRILPSTVETSELPKHWYCEMNTYDPERSTCDAPEQTSQEILKEKRRRKRKLAKIARLEAAGKIDAETAAQQRLALDKPKSSRGRGRLAARSPNPKDLQDGAPEPVKRGRKKRIAEDDQAQGTESPTQEEASDSQKSRFKKQSSFGSTGRRSTKSDDAGTTEVDTEAEPVPKKRGRGRPPGRPRRNRSNEDVTKEIESAGKNDPDNQEWVACEKCQKWRRLPSHVSADSLPEVWYCSMNTWDPNSATCDAAEDKADPNHQEFGIYGSGVSTASYGNKLSYRNLIFGTGRKQNRPITERTRAAESLFLAPTDPSSENSYPKVMYANSSVFMPRLSNAQKANAPDAEKKISLFELMNHSNLWAELRAASNMPQPETLGSAVVNSSYECLSEEMKRSMKEIVLHAIGSGELACDEVLLEAQCRQWENVPPEWGEIRASCTIDKIEGAIRDLVADGRIESVAISAETGLSTPKYRRAQAVATSAPSNAEIRTTRCMKIAKPWKKARPSVTREWAGA